MVGEEASITLSFLQTSDHALVSSGHESWSAFYFLFFLSKMLLRGWACHIYSFSLYLYWFLMYICSFCSFKLIWSCKFKRKTKHTFSNISTKKGLVLCLI
ncbi:hypothetical protein Hanom_Chr08g00727291 [Helianthus anomalus]